MECMINNSQASFEIRTDFNQGIDLERKRNVKYIKDLDYALSTRPYKKVAISGGNRMALEDIEMLCNVLIKNTNKFTTLRLTLMTDPNLSSIIQHLVGKVKCETLIVTACEGKQWQSEMASFVFSSRNLKTLFLNASHIELNDEMVNAIIMNPCLLDLTFSPWIRHRSLYERVAKIISNGRLQSLTITGLNIHPYAVHSIEESMKGNVTLKSFSHNSGGVIIGINTVPHIWIKKYEAYLDIVCNKVTLDDIARSNHTLHKMDFSSNHYLLHKCLVINQTSMPTRCKIKKKIFLCKTDFYLWMIELSTDDHRPVIQRKKKCSSCQFHSLACEQQ